MSPFIKGSLKRDIRNEMDKVSSLLLTSNTAILNVLFNKGKIRDEF